MKNKTVKQLKWNEARGLISNFWSNLGLESLQLRIVWCQLMDHMVLVPLCYLWVESYVGQVLISRIHKTGGKYGGASLALLEIGHIWADSCNIKKGGCYNLMDMRVENTHSTQEMRPIKDLSGPTINHLPRDLGTGTGTWNGSRKAISVSKKQVASGPHLTSSNL